MVALGAAQTRPQAPQLLGLFVRFVSQPSAGLLLQSAKPKLQLAIAQVPPEHTMVALGAAQTRPQAPQLLTSVPVFTQVPLHTTWPGGHCVVQVPLTQLVPLGQAWPQAPQLLGSFVRLISQPLAALVSQSAKPALQLAITQLPPEHAMVALGAVQTRPQAPQLLTSVPVFTQVPLHTTWPGGHCAAQVPFTQLVPLGQALPQAPQLALSVFRFTQLPLQLVWPAGQVSRH
jgi:hypothetical protein